MEDAVWYAVRHERIMGVVRCRGVETMGVVRVQCYWGPFVVKE